MNEEIYDNNYLNKVELVISSKCNISCNYCHRKYDYLNEGRSEAMNEVLTPEQAAEKFENMKEGGNNIELVNITGPGEALANFEDTKKAIELIKEKDPDVEICITTNGLMLPEYGKEIVDIGVKYVTITINTVDPKIGAKIYKFINYDGKIYSGENGAKVLLKNQMKGLKYLAANGVVCKVNIVAIKDINNYDIENVIKKVKKLGALMTNIIPLAPERESIIESMLFENNQKSTLFKKKGSADLLQMLHLKQCKTDAIGANSKENNKNQGLKYEETVSTPNSKPYIFAVASSTGKLIDRHFARVNNFFIYKFDKSGLKLIDERGIDEYSKLNDEGNNSKNRIEKIVDMLSDCNSVLSVRIGYEPKKILNESNINSFELYDTVEDGINQVVNIIEGKA